MLKAVNKRSLKWKKNKKQLQEIMKILMNPKNRNHRLSRYWPCVVICMSHSASSPALLHALFVHEGSQDERTGKHARGTGSENGSIEKRMSK